MLSYDEAMTKLSEMRSRYDAGFSSADRLFIQQLYWLLFSKAVRRSNCADCYRDAYMEIYLKLKKEKTMPKEKNFTLRNGVVLHLGSKVYTNINLTDDVALDALNENPKRLFMFSKFPDNYEVLMKERKKAKAEEIAAGTVTTPSDVEVALAEAQAKNSDYEKQIADYKAQIEALKASAGNNTTEEKKDEQSAQKPAQTAAKTETTSSAKVASAKK